MPNHLDLTVLHYNSSSEQWEEVTTSGVKSIRMKQRLNSPREATIIFSNVRGKRAFKISRGDRLKIEATPVSWDDGSEKPKPPVFYGFCMEVESTDKEFRVVGLDTLGWLTNEIILTNPASIQTGADGADILKEIVSDSAYELLPSLGRMLNQTGVKIPSTISLKGKTRLEGMMTILNLINATPKLFRLKGNLQHKYVEFDRLPAVSESTVIPYLAGRFPRTTAPLDFIPTYITREEDDDDLINLVTVQNSSIDLIVSEPTTTPVNPVHRLYEESSIQDEASARLFARQILNQVGQDKTRWVVEAIPNRLDIECGDIIEFKSIEGGLAGKQMVFQFSWTLTPEDTTISMTVGRQEADFITAIRFAAGQSI
jgi:hypothetical protein